MLTALKDILISRPMVKGEIASVESGTNDNWEDKLDHLHWPGGSST